MTTLPEKGEEIFGYKVMDQTTVSMLGARITELSHACSGARVLYIENDDRELGFNLIYRTPQLDQSDSNHILEHLMLCSCSRYPSRDIFFDMDSKSYSTFMNGLTDNTYTYYPVCSQSEDQLLKIMDVFLCCMEEPDALKEDYFFRREALRYELESEDEELSLEGTVFNEDWGHLTDIQENADSFMAETLYEGQTASHLLGRAHFHYKDISFGRIRERFEKFYRYSNCLIVLYGKMDIARVLTFLDKEHLSRFPVAAGIVDHDLLSYFHEPVKQGFFGIFEVFVDTIVICTLTALVILCSGVPVGYGEAAGAELTISGFTSVYGGWVSIFTAVAMCCFAFSTIIGWGLYGTRCIEFLFSEKVIKPFMVAYSLVAILGATADLGLMWNIAETFNGLMAIPNLIAVFLLSGVVVKLVKEYFAGEGKES